MSSKQAVTVMRRFQNKMKMKVSSIQLMACVRNFIVVISVCKKHRKISQALSGSEERHLEELRADLTIVAPYAAAVAADGYHRV
ncbi:MAG: hypothetical protein ABW072_07410 [Sedimenticola sp.]